MYISTILVLDSPPYNLHSTGCKRAVSYLIDFSPLWDTMRERNVTQYYLLQNGIDNKTLDSLKNNKNITLLTLEKLCDIIGCTPNDVVRFKK